MDIREIGETSLDKVELTVRASNALEKKGYERVRDLAPHDALEGLSARIVGETLEGLGMLLLQNLRGE